MFCIGQLSSHIIYRTGLQSVSQPADQPVSQLIQSVSQLISQSVSQLVSHSLGQFNHSISYNYLLLLVQLLKPQVIELAYIIL